MSELTFDKSGIPLWNGANGSVDVDTKVNDPAKKIDPASGALITAKFDISDNQKGAFGDKKAGSIQLGFTDNTSVTLAPIWSNNASANADLDTEFNIKAGLDAQHLAMTLEVGAKADLSVAGSFKYGLLSANAEVDAGVDGRYVCVRQYGVNDTLGSILSDFFPKLALPGTLKQAPDPGALYALELGGYLKLGINASAGYSIKGTGLGQFDNFKIGDIKLSESYSLSVLGKLGLTAQIAGQFSVQVRAGKQQGWANVRVVRKSTKDLQVAADLKVGFESIAGGISQNGQTMTGQEFLGALLGVNARNWLNQVNSVITEAGTITSGAQLQRKLGDFASSLVSKYIGQGIQTIAAGTPELTNLLTRLQNVVTSYQNLDTTAITLFDRYYNVATGEANDLLKALQNIKALQSLADFGKQGEITPVLWNVFQQLTGGDPLTAILTNPFQAVQDEVTKALSLLQDDAHADIRKFIATAKSQFGLDPIFNEIAKFDTPANLQTQASDAAKGLISRLIGKAFNEIPTGVLQDVLKTAKEIADKTADFWKQFDNALKQASSQSFNLELNAAWERSSETDALIDVDINLQDPAGLPFLQQAGRGDFSGILADYNPNVVALNSGTLTHKLQSSSGVKINIVGWHVNFAYQNSFQVLTQAEQRISPSAGGRLNVFSTIQTQALQKQTRKTSKAEEQLNTNFTLQFLAVTNNVISGKDYDAKHQEYLLDVITGYAGSYNMSFTDSNTTQAKLVNALSFAKVLGLDTVGATLAGLAPMLQPAGGPYGEIDAEYHVMFTQEGLANLFANPIDEATLRSILKPVVLANYIGQGGIECIGWMYAIDAVEELWEDQQQNFVDSGDVLADAGIVAVSPIPGVPVPSDPRQVFDVNTSPPNANRSATVTLFKIEQTLFSAFSNLQALVAKGRAGQQIDTNDLVKTSNEFSAALNSFAGMANGQNTVFAIMDGLIQRANPGKQVRSSALALTIQVGGQPPAAHNLLFQL